MSQQDSPAGAIAAQEPVEPKLSNEQSLALEGLLNGKTVVEAARDAGISRVTVHRWLKSNPEFRAAYNRWHDEIQQSCKARLVTLTAQASEVVGHALAGNNPWVALQLLRATGMLQAFPAGPSDPQSVKRLDAVEARKQERKLDHLEDKYGTEQDDVWPPTFGPDQPHNDE